MLRKMMVLAGVVLALAAVCSAVQVDGYCLIASVTNHAGTKVRFVADSPGAITDSVFTDSTGFYTIDVASGQYDVYFTHQYCSSYTIPNVPCYTSFTMPEVLIYLTLSGNLSGTIGGVTYLVTANISIQSGSTLTILPNTQLIFDGPYSFNIAGHLYAVGSITDSIKFKPLQINQDWRGMRFRNNTSDLSELEYCAIIKTDSLAILCDNSSPVISHSLLSENEAVSIWCTNYSHGIINNCTISNNEDCGILITNHSSPTVSNCNIYNNDGNSAGGISCDYYSDPIIEKCVISNNTSTYSWGGGGIYAGIADPIIRNCTVVGNMAPAVGGGIHLYQSEAIIENTIICNNTGGGGIYFLSSNNASISYCNLKNNPGGAFSGTLPSQFLGQLIIENINGDSCDLFFNIFENPLFVNQVNGDYHLLPASPCIDAGNPLPQYFDPDSTIADMGAFYYDQSQVPQITLSTDTLDFGEAPIDIQVNLPLTIYNSGTANLVVSSIQTTAYFTTNFTPQDSLIIPGDSLTLTVTFRPHEIGAVSGVLTIQNNAEPVSVQLYGAGVGPVALTLTPTNPPIIIPALGGVFSFNINFTNLTTTQQTTDFWSEIILPGVGSLQVLLATDITLPGSISINRMRNQTVPASAPQGSYQYFGYVGEYPWTVEDYSSFEFRKIGTADGGGSLGSPEDWICSGEALSGEQGYRAGQALPLRFGIAAISPNPFNPTATIRYDLPEAGWVRLEVFDTAGRRVSGSGTTPTTKWYPAGTHSAAFDGSGLAAGVYIVRLTANPASGSGMTPITSSQKMVLLK